MQVGNVYLLVFHKPYATIGAIGNGATAHEQEGMVVNEEPQGNTKWRAENVVKGIMLAPENTTSFV